MPIDIAVAFRPQATSKKIQKAANGVVGIPARGMFARGWRAAGGGAASPWCRTGSGCAARRWRRCQLAVPCSRWRPARSPRQRELKKPRQATLA